MKNLFLADLEGFSESDVKNHIAKEYSNQDQYEAPNPDEVNKVLKELEDYDVLIAYESVGNWGCDSSSWFLFKHKKSGQLFEMHGSHCSCYGFEGQFDLEETSVEYLKEKIKNDDRIFYCGGYDEKETENQQAVKQYIWEM